MPASTLDELYNAHANAVFAFAFHLLGDESGARDVLQSVFVSVAGIRDVPFASAAARIWLLRRTHWHVLDVLRSTRATAAREARWHDERMSLFSEVPDPDTRTFDRALTLALLSLPVDQRVVVHLHLLEGLSFQKAAATLGISRNTAASRYRLALARLRTQLRPIYEELS